MLRSRLLQHELPKAINVAVTSAILLVGGMGTRMQPLTLSTPKPMLELLGGPITEHQIMKAKEAGIEEIVLATSYMSEVFTPHFGDGSQLGIRISYAVEEVALGTGGAIRNAADSLRSDGGVIIFNGDILSAHSLKEQIALHESKSADVSLHLTRVEDARPFGVVDIDGDFRISSFMEKMENPPTNLINAGCYIFNRSAIEKIPHGEVVSVERQTFPELLSEGARVFGYIDTSYWIDIGNPNALLAATKELLNGEPYDLGERATISPTARITNGSYIGADSTIGADAVLDNCIVGRGASIGAGAKLTTCHIAPGAKVPEGFIAGGNFFGFTELSGENPYI